MQLNWRQQTIAILAANPAEWLRVSEVFAKVESSIPIHIAMRRESHKYNGEIGPNNARWRLFLAFAGPLIERKSSQNGGWTFRTRRTDYIRLLPHPDPCLDCGGFRYLQSWGNQGRHGRKYFCPACTAPTPTQPMPAQASTSIEIIPKIPKKKLRLNAYQRRPKPIPLKPKLEPSRAPSKPRLVVTSMTPKPPPPPRLPDEGSIRIISPPPIPLDVTFENKRNLAGNLKWFLGLPSINFTMSELQRSDIGTILAKRGKTIRDFLAKVVFRINLENSDRRPRP